jgi:hypothetical protein
MISVRKIGAATALLLFALLVVTQTRPARSEGPDSISIRGTSGISDELIKYVAINSEWTSMRLPANEPAANFIRSICGSITDTYARVFFSANPKLKTPSSAMEELVLVPACFRWTQNVTVSKLPGETVDALLRRMTGLGAEDLFECATAAQPSTTNMGQPETNTSSPPHTTRPVASTRCNKKFIALVQELNPGVDLDTSPTLKLPLKTSTTTFKPNKSIGKDASEIKQEIIDINTKSGAGTALIRVSISGSINLTAPVDPFELTVNAPACVHPETGSMGKSWPYDATQIAQILNKDIEFFLNKEHNPLEPQLVGILDTGVETDQKNADHVPSSFIKFLGDQPVARGIVPLGHYMPFANDESGKHGTEIANIVTGGSGLRPFLLDRLSNMLKIIFVNIRTPTGSGPYQTYTIEKSSVYDGVNFAKENKVLIVNLSIQGRERLEDLLDPGKSGILFVVAAGNDHKPLGGPDTYPANYGGTSEDSQTHFITVAASDGDGRLAQEFSDFGSRYADLVAPGCAIPFGSGSSENTHHGTSFAAPIVSMAAALLGIFGVDNPKEIKKRLRVSVDFDPQLTNLVAWSGRLNIAKAASLYEDVLETTTDGVRFGLYRPVNSTLSCRFGGPYELSRIKKLYMDHSDQTLGVILRDDVGNLYQEKCAPISDDWTLVDKGNGEIHVRWSDFVDYVPHYRKQPY